MHGRVTVYFLFSKGSCPPSWIFIFSQFCAKIQICTYIFISCKIWWRSDYRWPSYCVFSTFKMAAVRRLGFYIFAIFVKNSNLRLVLHRLAKFGEDRMMCGRYIAYFLFPKWRASANLDFHSSTIFMKNSNLRPYLRRHSKFGEHRTIRSRVIA